MITLAAIRPAATTPQAREISVTPRIKLTMAQTPRGVAKRPAVTPPAVRWDLFDCQGGVDQLLAVRHFACEGLVGAFLCDFQPGIVFFRRQGHDLDVVLLECRDHVVVELLRFLVEE